MPIAIPLEDRLKEVKSLEDKVNCVLELARTLEALHGLIIKAKIKTQRTSLMCQSR